MKIENVIAKKTNIKKNVEIKIIYFIKYGLILLTGFFIGRNYPDILNQVVIQAERYTGLITGIATVALVLVTIELVKLNEKVWRTENKPLLYFYIKSHEYKLGKNGETSPYIRLFVVNVGKGPATKVKFNVFESLRCYDIDLEVLASGEELNVFEIIERSFPMEFIVDDIKYNDFNGLEYSQKKVFLDSQYAQMSLSELLES